MQNVAEQKLKSAVAVVTALLLHQLLWGGGRLLFLSEPEPVLPVESALQPGVVNYQGPAPVAGEIVGRPLFWRGRKAFVYVPTAESGEEESESADSGPIERVKLLGIYTAETPGVIVMLKGERYRVSQGEKLEGWTLSMMSADEVTFENGDQSRVIELQHAIPKASKESQQSRRPRTVERKKKATVARKADSAAIDQ